MAQLHSRCQHRLQQRGVTLIELVITLVIAALVVAGLSGIVTVSFESRQVANERNDLMRQARFAMDRMVRAVSHSRLLLLPLADNPGTNWREHVREQTVPPSSPEGDSTNATAVLAVTLPLYSDLDFNGIPDADNDGDSRVDEDSDSDKQNDFAPGIYQIDDDGDGQVDEGGVFNIWDDDEHGGFNEDALNVVDDDADGSLDEDPGADMNGDGCSGLCGVDDDGDSVVDEHGSSDDDEDGSNNEDWYDPVVFYLDNGVVKERTPTPWDETGAGGITGRDFLTSDIADNVTLLRFARLTSGSRYLLVDISITLTAPSGETVSLNTACESGEHYENGECHLPVRPQVQRLRTPSGTRPTPHPRRHLPTANRRRWHGSRARRQPKRATHRRLRRRSRISARTLERAASRL